MVKTRGFPYEFVPQPWGALRAEVAEMAGAYAALAYLNDLVGSITESSHKESLAGNLWMFDLAVAASPISSVPVELIVVRSPGSVHATAPGLIRIEHLSVSGRNDRIDRPADQVVPLFWRFAAEKFGV